MTNIAVIYGKCAQRKMAALAAKRSESIIPERAGGYRMAAWNAWRARPLLLEA